MAPLDSTDIRLLRNTAICGAVALVVLLVGIPRLVTLVLYMLFIAAVVAIVCLYNLDAPVRELVVARIKQVVASFGAKCMEDALKKDGPTERRPDAAVRDSVAGESELTLEYARLFDK